MSVRMLAIAAGLLAAMVLAACQGNFAPPRLASPRDPANGQLPSTPRDVRAEARACEDGAPRLRVTWEFDPTPELGGFQIYRAETASEDPGLLIASSVPAGDREFVDGAVPGPPPLAERMAYWYRVRALGTDDLPGLRSAPDSASAPDCP
jgi:hypothetical protein